MKKAIIICNFLIIGGMVVLPTVAMAQIDFGDQVLDVPFDGGVSLLVAAGIGYGLKKAHEKRHKA